MQKADAFGFMAQERPFAFLGIGDRADRYGHRHDLLILQFLLLLEAENIGDQVI